MKKNLLAMGAIVLAIVFSAFTIKPLTTVYFVYDGSGTQRALGSYTSPAPTTSPGTQLGSDVLAWFQGSAANPSSITTQEFQTSFDALDGALGGTVNSSL